MKVEIRMTLTQDKEPQRMLENHQNLGERHGTECLSEFSEGSNPVETVNLDLQSPEPGEKTLLFFKPPSLCTLLHSLS